MTFTALHVQTLVANDSDRRSRRRGLTLTEILIAITITLVLLGVLIRMFSYASGEITKGRAVIEMSGQLRLVSDQLRNDLNGLTCPTRPWTSSGDGLGYFEYYEGIPHVDVAIPPVPAGSATGVSDNTIGDIDDVLMFTARSRGAPFRGRYWPVGSAPTIIESDLAEIIWWTVLEDTNGNGVQDTGEQVILRRRVLLIRPDLNIDATNTLPPMNVDQNGNPVLDNNLVAHYERNDISVRQTANGLSANTLADLSRRENRFAHYVGYPPNLLGVNGVPGANYPATFPGGNGWNSTPPVPGDYLYDWQIRMQATYPNPIDRIWLERLTLVGNYEGEDIALSSLISFDIKIYDPTAPVYDDRFAIGVAPAAGNVALTPSDPGYDDAVANLVPIGQGAFVNLGYALTWDAANNVFVNRFPPTFGSQFSGAPIPKSGLNLDLVPAAVPPGFPAPPNLTKQLVYSTWPTGYETDGINQDAKYPPWGNTDLDQGTDGIDSDSVNGTDDPSERETSPPYPFPVRGIEVTFRVIEPDTQQVRQASVVQNFIPE